MPNPVEQIVTLAKKGDRRVLLGGAAVIGGGVGLIVYLRNRGGGGGGFNVLPNQPAPEGTSESGGSGGTGGDLSSLLDSSGMGLEAPTLPELAPAETTGLYAESALPNLAGTAPISLPELAPLSASPFFPAFPTLDLPTLQPSSYTGGSYGNDLGSIASLPASNGPLAAFRNEPALTIQQPVSQPLTTHEIAAETYKPAAISLPAPIREIAADIYTTPARELSTAISPRTIQADVYVPGQGIVLRGMHESYADYYGRAQNYLQSVITARQVQTTPTYAAPRSDIAVYTPPARSTYTPPTAQTARAETYTSPVRTAAAESYAPKAREYAEPTKPRTGLVVKPDSAKARLA